MPAKCAQCGATSDKVRLYRSYGTFRRPESDRCNACLPADSSFMVPLILSDAEDAYGFSSAPDDKIREFIALPESSDKHPSWTETGWSCGVVLECVTADIPRGIAKADAEWERNKRHKDKTDSEQIRLKNQVTSLALELAEMRDRCRELNSCHELQSLSYVLYRRTIVSAVIVVIALTFALGAIIGYFTAAL